MERTKQKSRKDKSNKVVDKGKSSSFIADVKTFKENLKIREILRTVKMNNSMRIKAPRGSKVMQNKDFIDNEEYFDDTGGSTEMFEETGEGQSDVVPPSATNTILTAEIDGYLDPNVKCVGEEVNLNESVVETNYNETDNIEIETSAVHKCQSISEGLEGRGRAEFDSQIDSSDSVSDSSLAEIATGRCRDRKLSLDYTILSRREGLSRSEVDLHSIGKLPLERKSSFFRKKMDSFLKNTTEIFKRQSLGSKSVPSPLAQRRASNCSRMSVSLQSLNENSAYEEFESEQINKYHNQEGSVTSLRSSTTPHRSNSTVSVTDRPPEMSEDESLPGSRQELVGSQPLPVSSLNIPTLHVDYMQDSLLSSRASSMSSGLDTATGQRRRKTSRSNRVSWLASESLTDYFRRLIQDEKGQETQETPHQDFSPIPESKHGPRIDSKGRRLSYVRAVSGEDPVLPSKSQDSSLRRKKIPEYEANLRQEIEGLLVGFSATGIPPIVGYTEWQICADATRFLEVLGSDDVLTLLRGLDWGPAFAPLEPSSDVGGTLSREKRSTGGGGPAETDISAANNLGHEVLKELIYTEALHIRHLKVIVQVYIAAAHSLQSSGALDDISTSVLFLNMPDILNANIKFWERAIYPMLVDARNKQTLFDTSLMIQGLCDFAEIFEPYEEYMQNQKGAVEYLRKLNDDQEFITYLTWCDLQTDHRLQLSDMLVKPMQRITKYTLIINRLIHYAPNDEKKRQLEMAESIIKSYMISVNRSCRQKDELDILKKLEIEPYEPDFKGDEEVEKAYRQVLTCNLFLPMVDCAPYMMRTLIHQGSLRYKDYQKEFDAHIFLFTDMVLICKKLSKSTKIRNRWKMQRPKILLHRTIPNVKPGKTSHDAPTLIFITTDEHGCSQGAFQLSETSKDPNPIRTLKVWESKFYEAMMTYTLTRWYNKYPVKDLAIIEKEHNDDVYKKENPEVCAIEKRARERVAAMLVPNKNLHFPDAAREMELPQNDFEREKGPVKLHNISLTGHQHFNAWQARGANFHQHPTGLTPLYYTSTEMYLSFSGDSHDEMSRSVTMQQSDSSVEHFIPSFVFDDVYNSPSITVNVVPDYSALVHSGGQSPPTLVLQQSSPNLSPGPRSASAGAAGSDNTLRVLSPSHSMMHSLPDINTECHRLPETHVIVQTASEKLYRSHQELVLRNRLAASQQYLGPDHRGSSYPPPSPTRPLLRGLAFSYSFRGASSQTPPLQRSQNVSTSPQHAPKDLLTDVKRLLRMKSPTHKEPRRKFAKQRSTSASPTACRREDISMPSTSADKPAKKKSLFQKRSKETTMSASPERTQGEHSDDTDYDADDDRSRRSSKSNKGEKLKLRLESTVLEERDITAEEHNKREYFDTLGRRKKKDKDQG